MKKMMLWMGLMSLALCPAARGILVETDDFNFQSGGDTVTIHSEVDLTGGIYTYRYKITSTDLYVFHVLIPLLPGSNADPLSYGVMSDGGISPALWQISSSPLSGMAVFGTPVNPGAVSDTFYFESDQAPTESQAIVTGLTANFTVTSANGQVFTPIPEPATLALLAVGMGVVIRRRKSC